MGEAYDRVVTARRVTRWVGLAGGLGLFAIALVLTPWVAFGIDARLESARAVRLRSLGSAGAETTVNIAGALSSLGHWWDAQPGYVKAAVLVGAAVMIFGSGFAAVPALNAVGAVWWSLDHADDAGQLVRDPRGATLGYLTSRTPADVLVDAGLAMLTFVPGLGGGGRLVGRAGQEVVDSARLLRRDPVGWRRVYGHPERGSVGRGGPREAVDDWDHLSDDAISGAYGMMRPAADTQSATSGTMALSSTEGH